MTKKATQVSIFTPVALACTLGACAVSPDSSAKETVEANRFVMPEQPQNGHLQVPNNIGNVYWDQDVQADLAKRFADSIAEYSPLVAKALGLEQLREAELWLLSNFVGTYQAYTTNSAILLNLGGFEEGAQYAIPERVLIHELVHWHVAKTPLMKNLTYWLHEGISDCISLQLTHDPDIPFIFPADAAQTLAAVKNSGGLPQLFEHLEWGILDSKSLSFEEREPLYALGFYLVNKIGTKQLLSLVANEPVSMSQILKMAQVQRDGTGLELALPLPVEFRFSDHNGRDIDFTQESRHQSTIPTEAVRCQVNLESARYRDFKNLVIRFYDCEGKALNESVISAPAGVPVPPQATSCSAHLE